jgi:hypothetical protein
VDGNWVDEEGKAAELYVQRVSGGNPVTMGFVQVANNTKTLLYLIRRSYSYIYSLMVSSQPVSEALLPVYNQLQTLKRCLVEVKNQGGVSNVRELYPYSMKVSTRIRQARMDA